MIVCSKRTTSNLQSDFIYIYHQAVILSSFKHQEMKLYVT
jgi:hypothetical protein